MIIFLYLNALFNFIWFQEDFEEVERSNTWPT